jgi:hypothetical protein
MALRPLESSRLAEVIPLRPVADVNQAAQASPPEPKQLYELIVLALLLHTPTTDADCFTCVLPWPCEQVRLAYRLREGF